MVKSIACNEDLVLGHLAANLQWCYNSIKRLPVSFSYQVQKAKNPESMHALAEHCHLLSHTSSCDCLTPYRVSQHRNTRFTENLR